MSASPFPPRRLNPTGQPSTTAKAGRLATRLLVLGTTHLEVQLKASVYKNRRERKEAK